KAMSKTARSCRASSRCKERQRPAILPWRFEPCLAARGDPYRLLIGSCQMTGRAYRRRLDSGESVLRFRRTNHAERDGPARNKSPADAEFLDQILVARFIGAAQIIEKLPALPHHLEQPTARMIVFDVGFEMLGEIIDALGEDRHLHFGRPGVPGLLGIGLDYFGLAAGGHRHRSSFLAHGSAH